MEPANEKTYTSPQRKLVTFFERRRNRWKAKWRAAKTVRNRLGTRLRRVERSNAAYPQQLAALQPQLAEGQAQQEQTARELEELKKNAGRCARTANWWCAWAGDRPAASLERAARAGGGLVGSIGSNEFARGRARVSREAGLRWAGAVESLVGRARG